MPEGEIGKANLAISKTSVSELLQEQIVPERNTLQIHQDFFHKLGSITRSSLLPGGESQRPISLKTKRAEIFKKIKTNWHTNEARNLVAEAKIRDEIARQYLNQGEVSVDFTDLGEQKARYIHIKPPKEVDKNLDPIFLIPGISNDLDCVGWLVQELAYQGREVITIGFPESFMGNVTSEFADLSEKEDSYEPHTTFFKQALNKLISDEKTKELWGYSTGAPIIAEMLQDEKLQKNVSNAVLICPASSANMSSNEQKLGVVKDVLFHSKKLDDITKFSYTSGRNESDDIEPESKEQRQLKKRIFNRHIKKTRQKKDTWKSARVMNGGEIVVVSGEKDNVTKSRETFSNEGLLKSFNPQIRLVTMPNGRHFTPLIYPELVIEQI
ncbi:MAG: hypothetical protein Q7T59_00885 [Candidatus Woesebacteria bacterium]|nr:hypothetical protein [Candidatus Woesebacteria bacterium]